MNFSHKPVCYDKGNIMVMRGKKNIAAESEKQSVKTSTKTTKIKSRITVNRLLFLVLIVLGAVIGVQQKQIFDLQQAQEAFKSNLQQDIKQNAAQIKKVYVYNLEETLRGVNLEAMNREFEAKLNVLNDEVSTAQKKISSLKETKDKDDFSDVYLKSLKLKRDTMMQEYNRTLEDLTAQINQTVSEVAKEKNASVIFDIRAIASLTENVEDVTEEVIKKVKLMRPKILDE